MTFAVDGLVPESLLAGALSAASRAPAQVQERAGEFAATLDDAVLAPTEHGGHSTSGPPPAPVAQRSRADFPSTAPSPGDFASAAPSPGDFASAAPSPGDFASAAPSPGDFASAAPPQLVARLELPRGVRSGGAADPREAVTRAGLDSLSRSASAASRRPPDVQGASGPLPAGDASGAAADAPSATLRADEGRADDEEPRSPVDAAWAFAVPPPPLPAVPPSPVSFIASPPALSAAAAARVETDLGAAPRWSEGAGDGAAIGAARREPAPAGPAARPEAAEITTAPEPPPAELPEAVHEATSPLVDASRRSAVAPPPPRLEPAPHATASAVQPSAAHVGPSAADSARLSQESPAARSAPRVLVGGATTADSTAVRGSLTDVTKVESTSADSARRGESETSASVGDAFEVTDVGGSAGGSSGEPLTGSAKEVAHTDGTLAERTSTQVTPQRVYHAPEAFAQAAVDLGQDGRVGVRASRKALAAPRELDVSVHATDPAIARSLSEQLPLLSRELEGLGEVRLSVTSGAELASRGDGAGAHTEQEARANPVRPATGGGTDTVASREVPPSEARFTRRARFVL
jgi:hypothetical protein